MIPKVIHYCWLSGDEFPPLIQKCIDTWKEKLPDYEFVLWDTNKFKLESNIWVKQAFETKKYAFAADYIRLYAVYNHGGIYLDTDVEVVKSFNDLLDRPYIAGAEGLGIIEAGVFGAEKNNPWVKQCIDYYSGKSFINQDGTYNMLTLPRIMMAQISKSRTFKEIHPNNIKVESQIANQDTLYMFPKDFFCAKNHGTGVIEKTNNTYSIHHFAMSWIAKERTMLPNIKRKLMSIFGVNLINGFIHFFGLRKLKRMFKKKP
ncbi:glycosyl transferase [Algibacter amylolyticus]|uniref:Glycosyl transferase n=1 Tax=Algibacter amylolyticus TaxID=1608400 RepID=A0A5M7BDT6_9FLAO|nr:glycosyltransferase [Algibacter amylolyticus]KAA5825591.1 glycosyl transferase [Algibacter amylolyticus]MBB5268183.1 mannosyltransferase OCH1-like enzyme [Algibacter amylolyticus]TSJ79889.1 glycosyl transferase [Algibacter amylolyticus]